jgi:hypothetical protein
MKKFAIGVIIALPFLAILSTVTSAAPKTLTGEIMDSQCALLGGHDKMIHEGQTEKECTLACVAIGGKFVLFDAATKSTYQLDDQKKASAFAGTKVKVTGDYNDSTKTIKIAKIEKGA